MKVFELSSWVGTSLVIVSVVSNCPDGSMQFPSNAFNKELFPEEMEPEHKMVALVLFSTKFLNGYIDLNNFDRSSSSK
jgi:hypothetical protein